MNKDVILIGAGGHGKVVADIVGLCGDRVLGFLDDNKAGFFCGHRILGTTREIGQWDCSYFPAVGNNRLREKLMLLDVDWYTAIHPSAVIAADVKIGEGTVAAAGCIINPGSVIGRGVILNTTCAVDHDNRIESFTHVSPGATLAGTVVIGRRCWISVGARIINNVSICADTVVGAGAVVLHDLNEAGTYVGVPARKLSDKD